MLPHRHQWKIVDKERFPSAYEQLRSTAGSAPPWVFQRKVVYTMRCERCGRVKQTVHKGPD